MTKRPRYDSARNAAIYFAADGYDPAAKGINGRRVAGESFIRGFFRHAEVDEFVSLAAASSDQPLFERLASEERTGMPVRHLPARQPQQIASLGTLFYPSPNFAAETWRRAPSGQAAWSICGITHTISTKGVMQGFHDLRASAQAEWDAVICTSRAVLASVLHQFELIDSFHELRFHGARPPRPQLPVIPLGVHSDAFVPDPGAGAALRKRLGLGPKDVLFTTIARLTPHEKFDPLPLYIAMQAAQRGMPKDVRLAVAFCGIFRDDYSRRIFEQGAAKLMPDVGFHLLDGESAADRKAVLSGADVFVFAIDNIQETFGLAPIEAMAAGLPVLVSDWDGLRDTVTADVGLRVATRTLGPAHAEQESFRHLTGVDSYLQYCGQASAMTEIDMVALTGAIQMLALNPDLRARMGAAGARRARAVYDWSQIVPQMQDLWQELALRRKAALSAEPALARAAIPVGPSPFAMFATYPTRRGGLEGERFIPGALAPTLTLAETLALRDYTSTGRQVEATTTLAAVHDAIIAAGAAGIDRAGLEARTGMNAISTDRALIWLLKYGFARRA
ncbi:MAG: glycosyltransferase family 4 protein [Gemmobacter sp.]